MCAGGGGGGEGGQGHINQVRGQACVRKREQLPCLQHACANREAYGYTNARHKATLALTLPSLFPD